MKIKHIEINNFKSFGQESKKIENLENLNFFIGKNNSGKTNILKALKYFFDSYETELRDFDLDDYHKQLFLKLNENLEIVIKVGIEFNHKELDFLFSEDKKDIIDLIGMQDNILIFIFEISKNISHGYTRGIYQILSSNGTYFVDRKRKEAYLDLNQHDIEYIEQQDQRYIEFYKNLHVIFKNKFILIPSVRKINVEQYSNGTKLVHDCSNLNSVLHDLINTRGSTRTIKEIEEICKKILSFKDFSIGTPIDNNRAYTYIDEEGINLSLDGYGAGTEGILKIITLIKLYPDYMFGIEEPEVHIHPEVQRALLNFLKENFEERGQIFVTTHSSIFISKYKNNNTFLVSKNKDNETVVKEIQDRGDFKYIKEELGHKNIDLFFYDMVVLIEGDTEERAFPIIADALNYRFDELGIKTINIMGKDKLKRIKAFLEYIRDSGIISFVIIDKNEDAENYIKDLIKARFLDKKNYHIWSGGDFEDSFTEEQIIKATKEIYGSKFDLTEGELTEKKKNKPTVKIIEEKLYEKSLGSLNKPSLGEELGLIIAEEINENNKGKRQKTEIEQVLDKIVGKLK